MIKFPVLIDIVVRKDGRSERVKQLSLPEPGEYGINHRLNPLARSAAR